MVLIALIMINEDGDVLGNPNAMPKFTENFIRVLPTLSSEHTNPVASENEGKICEAHCRCCRSTRRGYTWGKSCTILKHAQMQNCFGSSQFNSCGASLQDAVAVGRQPVSPWFATPAAGHFRVPQEIQVPDSSVTLTHACPAGILPRRLRQWTGLGTNNVSMGPELH
jgi:hypothetical protein